MPRNKAKFPDRLLPPPDIRALWRQSALELGLQARRIVAYQAKWLRFHKDVLDELREQGTWEDRDVRLLIEFVEWTRKGDMHARMANADPYRVHVESGRVFAHPGFKLEAEARREARIVAEKLMLGEVFDDAGGEGAEDGPPPDS